MDDLADEEREGGKGRKVTKSHYIEANRPVVIFPKVDQCASLRKETGACSRVSVYPGDAVDFNNGRENRVSRNYFSVKRIRASRS